MRNLGLSILSAGALFLGGCGGGSQSESTEVAAVRNDTLRAPALASAPMRAQSASGSGDVANQIIDSYEASTRVLTIPLVLVGTHFYTDVRITVGSILSLGVASGPSGVFDTYDRATNRLTIPVVRVGTTPYYNVVITVGEVLSVGGEADSYSVPVDLAQVSYPESYRTTTTNPADINTDPCNLNLSKVSYPSTWLGRYPLPAITGAPLKPAIKRSVMLKDVGLQPGNPAFIGPGAPGAPAGCTGNLQTALGKTVNRLHALGADYVNVTQWHWASDKPDGSWFLTAADDTFGTITDADLAGLVQQAHAAGLKVIMRNQIQGFFEAGHDGEFIVPANSAENYAKWFPAWQAYIAERSVFFQSIGLDAWELGCGACMFHDDGDGSQSAANLFAAQYALALDTMKLHFTGEVMMSMPPWLTSHSSLASRIDIFEIGFWGLFPPPAGIEDSLTVTLYRTAVAASFMQSSINLVDSLGKTIMISYGIQSRRSIFSMPGYLEETACTAEIGGFATDAGACAQRAELTDFSMQAIVHEAMLEAISKLTTAHSTLMVNVNDYWEVDSLMPFTAFPNLAFSIRNKPAEGIVKAWFAR